MARVTLDTVVKSYGRQQVVHEVSAAIDDGEFIVIVGPSGCGKSTILRMIAGLEEITAGAISIDGTVVNRMEPKDRNIAMVFQNYALYPHMSVFNNMAYGLKLQKLPAAEIDGRVREAAELLQLAELLGRKPQQLSGGQRQRVAMGRAIVRKPGVFLFDEPLSNLDAKLRQQMRVELRKLHGRLGTTMIYVTHDQVEAMTLADRIMVVNEGRIEQFGAPDEIYHRPASKFVADFIGSPPMNFLSTTVDGHGRLLLPSGIVLECPHPVGVNGACTLGIRPEDVRLGGPGTPGSIPYQFDFAEKLGNTAIMYGTIGGEPFTIVLQEALRPPEQEYRLVFDCDRLHFFAADTGLRHPPSSRPAG